MLAKAAVDRLIRKAGAERVSEDAAVALSRALEKKAVEISQEAMSLAEHAGRKTVKREDIELAAKRK